MDRLQFIELNGKNIFYFNYSNLNSLDEVLDLAKKEMALIVQQPLNSVLIITDLTNMMVDKKIDDAFTEMLKKNKSHVKRSAAIGITGFKRTLYNIMIALTGRDIKLFDSLEDAKIWIVSD